jgi:hypothetical protein
VNHSILDHIIRFPEGHSKGLYKDNKYGITKEIFNNGKPFKRYAEVLGGADFFSLNYYIITKNQILKPCEMSEKKSFIFYST